MPRTLKEAKQNLAKAILHAKTAKQIIEFFTKEGRMLIRDEDFHQLKDLTLILGNDAAIAESNLAEYGRVGFFGNRFAVQKKITEIKK